MNMSLLIQYAFALIAGGVQYSWGANPGGGDDPISGFDCSGFCSELMRAAGVIGPRERLTAQGLFDRLSNAGSVGAWAAGSLAFYGKDVREVTHVAFCLDSQTMIEFGGGDSAIKTEADAAARNAFGRMRPIRYRSDFLQAIKPFYRAP